MKAIGNFAIHIIGAVAAFSAAMLSIILLMMLCADRPYWLLATAVAWGVYLIAKKIIDE